CFFFQAEDGIRDRNVTGVQTCALPIWFQISSSLMDKSTTACASGWSTSHIVFLDANVLTSTTVLRWLFDLRAALVGEGCELRLVTPLKTLSETGATTNWRVPQSTGAQRDQRMAELRRGTDDVLPRYPAGLCLSGTDPGDSHVHAAATACQATTLLSFNRPPDFPKMPARESYRLTTPDAFLQQPRTTQPGWLGQV